MSALDRHVAAVRARLTLHAFADEAVRAALGVGIVAFAGTLVTRLSGFALPTPQWFLAGIVASGLVWATIRATRKRPTPIAAAAAIDDRLGLDEKFSTALFARPMDDPFARAAVEDAERTATTVSIAKQFPFRTPPLTGWAVAALLAFALTAWLMHPLDLFGHRAALAQQTSQSQNVAAARKDVQDAITRVQTIAKALPGDQNVEMAKKDLQAMLDKPISDPEKVKRTAAETLSNLDQQMQQQIAQSKQVAQANNQQKMLDSLQQPADNETGPVADAHRDLAKGDFTKAVDDLNKAVEKFDKMPPAEQKKAAEQMAALSQQLAKMANNPAQQQQVKQQMQQMGATQQQAQQMQQMLQQAAAGDQNAQKQLQQMANQMQKQMNGGKGATQQQQQAMQKMMQQAQAQASSQMQAQQMSQAAQQMAQAMQQSTQGQQQQNGQGQQNPQAGNSQQQMANAQQSMQEQMQQMQAIANDAQQQAAAREGAQQAAQDAADQANGGGDGQNGGDGSKPGQKPGGAGQGKWAQGNPNNKPGGGFGGPGQGNHGGPGVKDAPFAVKQEIAPVQTNERGKLLATPFVKAGTIRGESHAGIQEAVRSAQQETTDDVDTDVISGDAKQAVKGYFGQLSGDQAK